MPYATVDALEWRFGEKEILQLSDRDRDGVADLDVLTEAIYDAEAIVNTALAARYTVPVVPTPQILAWIACQLVRYELHEKQAPERVMDGREHALQVLADLAAGVIDMVDNSGNPILPIWGSVAPFSGGAARRVTATVQDAMP